MQFSYSVICSFAYVEFAEKESVENALKLDDSTFKGRQLKVSALFAKPVQQSCLVILMPFALCNALFQVLPKRQNLPMGGGRGGGRGGRGGRFGPVYGGRFSSRAGGRGAYYPAARGYFGRGPGRGRGRGRHSGGYFNSYY